MGMIASLQKFLFDFSEGQKEGRRLERMLRVALAETTSEAEFRALFYRMIQEDDYLKTQIRWQNTLGQLDEFLGARDTDWRIAAERLINWLPCHYGYRSDWQEG